MQRLLQIMAQLRDPERGCPWDRKQNFHTIVPHTIEEAFEVAEAIFSDDMSAIKDELGDLLFQIVFYAQLAKEQKAFDFEDIAQAINEKMIRRHPHVFAQQSFMCETQLAAQWQRIKQQERVAKKSAADASILAGITKGLSPLMRANKLQQACAKVGFDWSELPPVIDKIHEEIAEVLVELNAAKPCPIAVEEEMGDLLFSVVNFARHCKVDPESALIKANQKFEQRFRQVEHIMQLQGHNMTSANVTLMEQAWQQVKGKPAAND
jgi:ATP diphosphatase